ncbi:MAG: hypothetical protein IPN71_04260 [Fibrobacteres bacterium]|nr:hypothetical protein [Fibrobacterota bacterium]
MSKLPTIADEVFWSDSNWIVPLQNRMANECIPAREILMPGFADRTKTSVLPAYLVQAGPFEEFREGSIAEEGYFVLIDIDRNALDLARIDDADDSPVEPRSKEPREPTGSPYGLVFSPFDLAARFFPDFPHATGNYRALGILPLTATRPVAFRVGGDPTAFDRDLSASLALIPDRTTLPPELLQEDHPWKAMAAPPSLPEGLRARVQTESGRNFLEIDFALPELRGERLHLEPGAVLPSGNRPPEAVKWIHVLAAGEDCIQPAKVLLPVVGGAQDPLVRGHAKIDLNRLFSGMASGDFQSIYVICGPAAIGPLELPLRKP